MSISIQLRAGSLSELNNSTKPVAKNELLFLRGKCLRVAKENGVTSSVDYSDVYALATVLKRSGRTAAPKGAARMVSMKTSNVAITVQHDGTGGATGICYSVTGGTPVYAAVAANTNLVLSIPHKSGAPFEIWVWPSSAANGGVKGNLTYISCPNNSLTSMDISGCTALTVISCPSNSLTSLDVSGCTALATLSCYSNSLTSLDVSGLTALTTLYCSDNSLTSLDVSGRTALTTLHCDNNSLTSLNVSGCTSLTGFLVNDQNLVELRAVGCTLSYGSGSSNMGTDLKNNNLSAAALDQFYTDLADVVAGTLLVGGNPGTTGDDPTIATDNGYTVVGT